MFGKDRKTKQTCKYKIWPEDFETCEKGNPILHDGCALCSDFNCDDSCVISDEGKCKYNRRISLFCTACTGSLWIQARTSGSE